jgi:peptidoglycan/LPS O-acetylase OafA/YrhL
MNSVLHTTTQAGISAYRSEVDSLRAVAIIAVVLYHAHVPGFDGGFVGVDVFFVISGYLIIGLLYREFEQTGKLSLAGFFERRIRRLGPALVVVLLATLVLAAVFLTPINGEQQGLAKSAIATVALVSNLYFARHTGGYFDGPAEAQPLLHTWSLSVEEQFYLFWPLVVLAAGRFSLHRGYRPLSLVVGALAGLFALSLAWSLWWTSLQPQTAFFAAPTRAWEFAAGGLVFFALRQAPSSSRHGGLLAVVGLAAIAIAVTRFHRDMAFPGYLALLPVLGTSAVIFGCALAPRSLTARWLSLRPVVAIGLVSYGWYLWHWPLLAIARVHTLGEMGPLGIAGLCILSLGLAALTYRYIEAPIRQKRSMLMATRHRAFGVGATAMVGVILVSAVFGSYAKLVWAKQESNSTLASALAGMHKIRLECWQPRPYAGSLLKIPDCDLPRSGVTPGLLVWGDSHASSLVPMLAALAGQHNTAVRVRFMPECPPLQNYLPMFDGINHAPGCDQFNRDVLAEIADLQARGLHTVVIAAHWWAYLQNAEAGLAAQAGLQATLTGLDRLGVRTLIAAPVPEYPHEVPACLARRTVDACGAGREAVEQQRSPTMAFLEYGAVERPLVRIVDPLAALCDAAFCAPIRNNVVLFSDAHHLTEAGSMSLLPLYAESLEWSRDTGSADIQPETSSPVAVH